MVLLSRLLVSLVIAALAYALYWGMLSNRGEELSAPSAAEQHFALEVWPVLEAKCATCHGADPADVQGGLDLTSLAGLMRGGETGGPAIVPGDPHASLLIEAIRREGLAMPPKDDDRLNDKQIAAIERWIAEGAPWPDSDRQLAIRRSAWRVPDNAEGVIVKTSGGLADDWTYRRYAPTDLWAYQPIRKPELLATKRNPIDILVDRRLAEVELKPAPQADPLTLIRRATFDVLGLPPTPSEIRTFLGAWQENPNAAWTQLVDRLLESPHYGEQAARHWLDVARYADSGGFSNDWMRPNAWRYRDYVIRAFNDDKPFDRFVREQLAGDELDADDPEMRVAVGFLRMGPWEHSFMSVPKVSRQRFLDDVTAAVGQVFLAHPVQCARCHDHKFDPVPMRDYYALQAVFATTQLGDVDAAWLPEENLDGLEADQREHERKLAWNQAIVAKFDRKKALAEKDWFRERHLPYATRREAVRAGAGQHEIPEPRLGFTPDELGRDRVSRKWQHRWRWERTRYEPVAMSVYNGKTNLPKAVNKRIKVPADPFGDGELQQTTVLLGGDPFSPGAPVKPGVLSAIDIGSPVEIPLQPSGRRLALAEWLVDPANPLTPRVIANRVWQSHFGRGIVGTPNNFGAKGKKPTHPQLLDFLSTRLVEGGWSLKQLHRLILSSETYRRASHTEVSTERFIEARSLYAVFTPRRLRAEELRDAMLAVSGELNPEQGGIPARPDMNFEAAFEPRLTMSGIAPAYVPQPLPEQRNRRSIYALQLRGLRDPFMEVFNQPSADVSCERREQSNVTPQVLTLLNSQESADRALALAKRVLDSTDDDATAIEQLYSLVYGREPSAEESVAASRHWLEMQRVQSNIEYQPARYPTQVVRRANEETSGQLFEFVERLFAYEDYVPDIEPHQVDARTRALADICLVLLNSNEFVYVY